MTQSKPPIFIVGVHRSGTTLLRFMLSSHSQIYIPTESDFIPLFYNKSRNQPFNQETVSKILDEIFEKYRFVNDWQDVKPEAGIFLSSMETKDYRGFLDHLYSLYAQQNGAVRWGDKTPIYTSYLDLIQKIFPDAKFIHIIRDPYDAIISLLEKYQEKEFHIDIYFGAKNWVRRIKKAQRDGERIGKDQYLEIFYEDLTNSPESTLKKICAFIEEKFEPGMLDHHELAQKKISPESYFFGNVINPVSVSRIGRGRRGLNGEDKQVINLVAGKMMEDLGYKIEPTRNILLRNRFRILTLAVKYKILQLGRRTMTRLGIMPPI